MSAGATESPRKVVPKVGLLTLTCPDCKTQWPLSAVWCPACKAVFK